MEWISIEDKIPESDYDVIVCTTRNYIEKASYDESSKKFFSNGYFVKNVTHWMELPETPKDQP